jgi:uncharacterized protein (TIGR00661 family)
MAKIIYGVMGNTYGHIARTMAITRKFPEHEFLFVGGGRVPEVMKDHRVFQVPVLRTIHKNQKVSKSGTAKQAIARLYETPSIVRSLVSLMEEWQPDLAICDREFFLPIACHWMDFSCTSLDHSHLLKACEYSVPQSEFSSWSAAMLNDYLLFHFTRRNLIVSFYHPPLKNGSTDELFPPVLRTEAEMFKPSEGERILVYQTSPTFRELLPVLQKLKREVIVYGMQEKPEKKGNITFKSFDSQEILRDLSECCCCITNGGHNLICEALFYQKPIFCFPVKFHFEQFLNSYYVNQLGFGRYSLSHPPVLEELTEFESHLAKYKINIKSGFQNGTDQVIRRVRQLIEDKK